MAENINHDQIIERIKERQKRLKEIAKELKQHFVGLDKIIDKIIRDIETWYVMPELLTRPAIICLWGPTGVGKTDLVRRLVKLLSFQDRFCEIELMNKGSASYQWYSSISSILSSNPNIVSAEPSVILLDEIQNFRTVDEDGHQLEEYKFRDVWTLLSDGSLPFKLDLDYLLDMLWSYKEKERKRLEEAQSPKPIKKKRKKKGDDDDDEPEGPVEDDGISYYQLKHLKNALRLSEPIEEIATWDDHKKRLVIMEKINDQSIYDEEDYSKCLIFISGNLDEAYSFANKAEEVDIDADIFHQMSLKISILDIKKALKKRFKPEQIARFGNMHIIYPTHSRKTYQTIIYRKVHALTRDIASRFGIRVDMDKSILNLIYDNGVYPTQGTRPVFSTISEIVEGTLPNFMLRAFLKRQASFRMYYEKKNICADIGGQLVKSPYSGSLDEIKASRKENVDQRVLTAVHEAGHAALYAILFKLAPPQLSALGASSDMEGFMYPHDICGSKDFIMRKISVSYGGTEAERLIFGDYNRTSGASMDHRNATDMAGAMVKRWGMDKFRSYMIDEAKDDRAYNSYTDADSCLEAILQKCADRSRESLKDNLPLLIDLVDNLINVERLDPKDFKAICKRHGLTVKLLKAKGGKEKTVCTNYSHQYKKFKEGANDRKTQSTDQETT